MLRFLHTVKRYRTILANAGRINLSLILSALLLPFASFAQTPTPPPDCQIFIHFTAINQTSPTSPNNGLNNLQTGCSTWALSVNSTGFTAFTVALQSAPNTTPTGAPGTYVTFLNQTIGVGANPVVGSGAGAAGYVSLQGYNPWVRVALTAVTGIGVIDGAAFGWRIPSAAPGGGGATGNVNVTNNPLNVAQIANALTVTTFADITGDGASHAFSVSGTARWCDLTAFPGNAGVGRTGNASISSSQGQIVGAASSYGYRSVINDTYSLSALFYLFTSGDKASLICGN